MPTIFKRTVQNSECRMLIKNNQTSRADLFFIPHSALRILRSAVSPRRPIWNVNRTSVPGLGANECAPLFPHTSISFEGRGVVKERGVVQVHGIPPPFVGGHQCARSSKRAGGRAFLFGCRRFQNVPAMTPALMVTAPITRSNASQPAKHGEALRLCVDPP